MAIFTIAVLLAGTIGYATSIYMLPSAVADDGSNGPTCEECESTFLSDADDCVEKEITAQGLLTCLEGVIEEFEDCIEECDDD